MSGKKGNNKPVDLQKMIDGICQKVNKYNPNADIDLLMQAYEFGKTAHHGQLRLSGEQYFTHALIVADVLSDLKLDTDTLKHISSSSHLIFDRPKRCAKGA